MFPDQIYTIPHTYTLSGSEIMPPESRVLFGPYQTSVADAMLVGTVDLLTLTFLALTNLP